MRHFRWALCLALTACGSDGQDPEPSPPQPSISSFTADQSGYFVGGTAQLTAVFANGTGRLEPGNLPVTSGVAFTTPVLIADIDYQLIVTQAGVSVSRTLSLDVSYRGQLRPVAMPFARSEHIAVGLPDGRALFIGGDDPGAIYPQSVYQFDPRTELFTPFAELSTGRTAMVAVTLASGDVLVAHGQRSVTGSPVAELIHGTTGAVTATVGEPVRPRRDWASATRLQDGRVLITGGMGTAPEATAEIYDPATGQFTLLQATLTKARYMHTSTLLDNGKVFIYGGWTIDASLAPGEIFDPATLTFTALPQAEPFVRGRHSAVKARDGRVWIIGGEDLDNEPTAQVLVFDQDSLYAPGPVIAVRRTLLAAAPLTDGRVLVAGGLRTSLSSQVEATTELVSRPLQRADGPLMATTRFTHTATALPNGKVLIVGGLSNQLAPLASAEIFE